MSNLIKHAEDELRRIGWTGEPNPLEAFDYDFECQQAALELVKLLASQNHSGMSHSITMGIFNELANFRSLTPITDNPEEWHDHTLLPGLWQNRRQGELFSEDGGKTYYSVNEPKKHPLIWSKLPKPIRVWLWEKHRSLVQPVHTSKIATKAKETAA